jgi:2-iminoacetate synthase
MTASLPMNSKMRFPNEIARLYELLTVSSSVSESVREDILSKATNGNGLSLQEAAVLLTAPAFWGGRIFASASELNARIKAKAITFYGVVYIHDYCVNHCTYCGDSVHAVDAKRKLLTQDEFVADVKALLSHHPLKQICFLMGEDWLRFKHDHLVKYLQAIAPIYREKIILNVPPLSVGQFRKIRDALPNNRLQFRVFQETYDPEIYVHEHLRGPKVNYEWRVDSQARALEAGFDEVGHGVLYGLNNKEHGHLFETLAMLAHARDLKEKFGKRSQSMSFPRVLPAPDIDYHPAAQIDGDTLKRCISVVKLADSQIDTVITCRETAMFRRQIRPIVNIEDYAARPGPGGNSMPEARQQMFLPDMRCGEEVRIEMIGDDYKVQ